MSDDFFYHVPTRVYFGDSQLENLGQELARHGRRVLLTYGSERIRGLSLYSEIRAQAERFGLTLAEAGGVEPNPRHTTVNRMAEICRREKIDVVLAVGGGSVLDCAKFVCAAAGYDGDCWDFFAGRAKMETFLPLVTIPTLAGTGSDMDAFGIISNDQTLEKLPLYHPGLFPQASFLVPSLTVSVSPYQTACGSIDAFSHYLEVYLMRPNLLAHRRVMEGFMKTILECIPKVMARPDDLEARANLMWASSWALNGFTFGTTGAAPFTCHWIEDELSAKYDMTHGLGLAILLPHYLEYCLNEETAPLYRELAVNVLGADAGLDAMEAARQGIAALRGLFFETCGLRSRLGECGVTDERHFAEMARVACRGGVIHGLIELTQEDVINIYRMSM
ncbi:MAG: iron-containing alcohol dehydrogenase [Desulfovibrionaceae bacterium]|nr:iron-containing alcohol dehydrogenase [Desulfovibrionaceae bacterium]